MSDAIGVLYESFLGQVPNFWGDLPRNVYATSGTSISPNDRFSVINSPTPISLTLPSGLRDGQPLLVKNLGAGACTLAATIDGAAGTTTLNALGALRLVWSAQFASWLSV